MARRPGDGRRSGPAAPRAGSRTAAAGSGRPPRHQPRRALMLGRSLPYGARSRPALVGAGCRRVRPGRRSQAGRYRAPGGCLGPAGDQARRGCSTRARRRDEGARGPGRRPGAAWAPRRLDPSPRRRSPGACAPWHRDRPPADRVTVDAERDVVEKYAAIHLRHVDLALDPVGERVESTDQVVPVHAHVEREVVARPGRNAHKRNSVRSRHCGHDRQRPITTSGPERVCAALRSSTGQRRQVLARVEDDGLDPLFARPLGNPGACGLAATRPGVDEQHRPTRRISGPPAIT